MRGKVVCLFVFVLFVCVDLCLLCRLTDLDIWARLAVGKLIFELGGVSAHDLFSYTPQKPLFVDHEWGSSVVFFFLADGWGQKGLILLRVLLFFGTVVFAHLSVRERIEAPNSLLLHLLLTCAVLFGFSVTVRSQTFTYLLFSLWLFLLERSRKGKSKALVLIPLTMIPWANLHGGFVSGIGLVLIYGTAAVLHHRPWKRYLGLVLLCLGVTLLNPYGLEYWHYLFHALTMPRPYITDWQPMRFIGPLRFFWAWAYRLFFFLAVSLFLLDRIRARKVEWVDVLLLLVTGYLGVRHVRHITFFCIACFPFVYTSIRYWWGLVKDQRLFGKGSRSPEASWMERLGGGALHGLVLAFLILVAFSLPMRVKVFDKLPVRAIAFIKENALRGNLLTEYGSGSYAIWELFPRCRVSIDGRYEEVYPRSTYEDIRRFTNGEEGWDVALEKYANDIILIRRNSPVFLKMKDRKDWKIVFEYGRFVIYLPADTSNREWLQPDMHEIEEKDPFSTKGRGLYVTEQDPVPSFFPLRFLSDLCPASGCLKTRRR